MTVGSSYLINLKVLDVRQALVIGRATREVAAEANELTSGIRAVTAAALGMVRTAFGVAAPTAPTAPPASAAPPAPSASASSPSVSANIEVAPETASGGTPVLGWIGLGAGAAAIVAGGLIAGLARSEASIEAQEYQTFRAASPAKKDSAYADVEAAVGKRNTMVAIGWAVVGVGVAGAAAGALGLLLGGDEPDVAAGVAPGESGAYLFLSGRF